MYKAFQISKLKIFNWGISKDTPFETAIQLRLMNVYVFLATFAVIPYLFIVKHSGVLLLLTGFVLAHFSTWIFCYYQKLKAVKLFLYTVVNSLLIVLSSLVGKMGGAQFLFIPLTLAGIIVSQYKDKALIYFYIGLSISSLIFLEITDYNLMEFARPHGAITSFQYLNLFLSLSITIFIGLFYHFLFNQQLLTNRRIIETSNDIEKTINYYSNSLYGQNSLSEVLWDIVNSCITNLKLEDCVIYLLDQDRNLMVQKAGSSSTDPDKYSLETTNEVPVDKGLIGQVIQTGESVILNDTSFGQSVNKKAYADMSILVTPIIFNNNVIGIIESKNSQKNFFTSRHIRIFRTIAALCANKITWSIGEREREKALKLQVEAEKIKMFDELKNRLFTNISHELRTPLTIIKGTAGKNLQKQNDWQIIDKQTDRLLRLINQILDLTKLEEGEFKLNPEPAEITSFIKLIISYFEGYAREKNIVIFSDIPDEPIWLNFDKDALEKIFYNLIFNAIKYSDNNTSIEISADYTDALTFIVKDEGVGISKMDQKNIFKRFYRLSREKKIGTGIGLSLCRELVELHSGNIAVESELNKGSQFTVVLPLDKISLPSIQDPKLNLRPLLSQNVSNDNESILIIEDSIEISDLIKDILSPQYFVIQSFDGKDGIIKTEKILPDLIICDIMMPEIGGIEVCRHLKSQSLTNHIPIIILTAKVSQNSKLEGLKTGADYYLQKPFDSEELLIRINNLLRQRRLLQEKFQGSPESPSKKELVDQNPDEQFLNLFKTIIQDHLQNSHFSVDLLCKEMGISRMQLHRKIKALTGLSANLFIKKHRLFLATELLSKGEPVSQSAYSVGYTSLSYFSKIFKEEYGVSPSDYEK
ncbi:ATP-binding protein [Membranihabitans maritimus]|uniref:ATP-binding protein n=1 Tax=Membranihabitans maritimus TaxID=2904244 RepID=UPI001F2AAFAE|nr:ATP-binding protein [Membranihabitans maritimus]